MGAALVGTQHAYLELKLVSDGGGEAGGRLRVNICIVIILSFSRTSFFFNINVSTVFASLMCLYKLFPLAT